MILNVLVNPMVHNMHVSYINIRNRNFHYSKCQGIKTVYRHLFSNAVKIMLFISDTQYYVPVQMCRTAGGIHLFKNIETLFLNTLI